MSMELIIPEPSGKQRLFLSDEHRFVAYGGARGGGKSWALRMKAVLLCLRHPGIKVMIIRKTNSELYENHILPMCALLRIDDPASPQIARYSDTRKIITFFNGSRILFGYCDVEKDLERYQGTEVDVLMVDEATQQSEEKIERLNACVRGVNSFPKRVCYTMNPGGVGHEWAKRLFIDRRYRKGEDPEDYSFIQARVTDNRALMEADPEYLRSLERLPEHLRLMWLEGRWDVAEGAFFEDFRTEPDMTAAREHGCTESAEILRKQGRWCHVIDALPLSEGQRTAWKIFRSYDFGYGRPFSCGWWAVDHDGVLYRILELYGATEMPNQGLRWPPDRQFEEIARIEREHPWLRGRRIEGVADPSIFDRSRGESIAETALKHGIHFTRGDNKRIPGWMQCHERLRFDENGYPMMYVFSNCTEFIRTVPLLQYSSSSPEDLDTDGEDHIADEWRYACMSRPIAPARETEQRIILRDPLNRW